MLTTTCICIMNCFYYAFKIKIILYYLPKQITANNFDWVAEAISVLTASSTPKIKKQKNFTTYYQKTIKGRRAPNNRMGNSLNGQWNRNITMHTIPTTPKLSGHLN